MEQLQTEPWLPLETCSGTDVQSARCAEWHSCRTQWHWGQDYFAFTERKQMHQKCLFFFAMRGANKHLNLLRIVFIHMLIRLGRSFSHSCEQALMNTNVWIPQQLLIIPLKGIIQLDGIIGTQRTETLGSGLPTVHTGMIVWQSWQSVGLSLEPFAKILSELCRPWWNCCHYTELGTPYFRKIKFGPKNKFLGGLAHIFKKQGMYATKNKIRR